MTWNKNFVVGPPMTKTENSVGHRRVTELGLSTLGDFQCQVLSIVQRLREDAYGMRIRDEVQIIANRPIHMPQVYAALARLEVLQMVSSEASPEKSAGLRGRTRRYYHITARGLQQLSDVVRHSLGAGPKDPVNYGEWEKASTAKKVDADRRWGMQVPS
jgi:DNA-binding PadR family transcriptional regulator